MKIIYNNTNRINGCLLRLSSISNTIYAVSVIHNIGWNVYQSNLKTVIKNVYIASKNKKYSCELVVNPNIPNMIQNNYTWDTRGDCVYFRVLDQLPFNVSYLETCNPNIGTVVYIRNLLSTVGKSDTKWLKYYGKIDYYEDGYMRVKMDNLGNDCLSNYSGSGVYNLDDNIIGLLSGADILHDNIMYLDCVSTEMLKTYICSDT